MEYDAVLKIRNLKNNVSESDHKLKVIDHLEQNLFLSRI